MKPHRLEEKKKHYYRGDTKKRYSAESQNLLEIKKRKEKPDKNQKTT